MRTRRTASVVVATTIVVSLLSAGRAFAQDTPPPPPPAASQMSSGASPGRIGIALRASTLGFGADVAVKVNDRLNVRGGFDLFKMTRDFEDSDNNITYVGTLDFKSGHAYLDWFPFGGGFHISPGLVLANGNKVSLAALVPSTQTIDIGDTTYRSNPANPLRIGGQVTVPSTRPALLIGWGNLVPRSRRFSVPFEIGVIFQGTATSSLLFTGSACALNGSNCRDVSTDPTIQVDVKKARLELQDNVDRVTFYPILSIGFGIRF